VKHLSINYKIGFIRNYTQQDFKGEKKDHPKWRSDVKFMAKIDRAVCGPT